MVVQLQIVKEKKMPNKNMVLRLCKSLSILILHFVIKAKKKYYPQILLEECKYGPKR